MFQFGNNPISAAGAYCILTGVQGNENSEVTLIDLTNVFVNPDFLELKKKMLAERTKLRIVHGGMEAEVFKKKGKVSSYFRT